MKQSLMKILILLSFQSLPGVNTVSNKEMRRRAATAFALRRSGLPRELLPLIASDGHKTRDQEGEEVGFFPENEWKRLKRVFRYNEKTNEIRDLIDHFSDARAAWKNEPGFEDNVERSDFGYQVVLTVQTGTDFVRIALDGFDFNMIMFQIFGFDNEDIRDLSNLPSNLVECVVGRRSLMDFPFSKLPKGLKTLSLWHHDPESQLHVGPLPAGVTELRLTDRGGQGIVLHEPLPKRLTVHIVKCVEPCSVSFASCEEPPQTEESEESEEFIEGKESRGPGNERITRMQMHDGAQICVIQKI